MRCPVCKADNASGPLCRRCKADLSLLFALEGQRAEALAEARRLLEAGRPREATRAASRADLLRRDEESRRVVGLAALLGGDFTRAWECYREYGASEPGRARPLTGWARL